MSSPKAGKRTVLIKLVGVAKKYSLGEEIFNALKPTSAVIRHGDYVAIKGPSGSGKSTLMHLIGLLDTPTTGKIYLEDRLVSELSEVELAKIRNRNIGFVFQQFHLLPKTVAWENVALPLIYAGVKPRDRRDLAVAALGRVGLSERVNHTPSQLSGGQQQRVAIARALVNQPNLILADEPTGNLDSASGKVVMEILDQLNREGKTVILVTHEDSVARHAKRRLTIIDGAIQ